MLEHIIFHASELFPQEGFGHYLGLKGGSNNAFTASTYTNFHFDIPKEHFLDALDRFDAVLIILFANIFSKIGNYSRHSVNELLK